MNNVDDMDDFFMSDGAYWQAPDFILTDIITTMVNMMEMPVGITIFMKGMIVSGSLVSERQYLGSLSAVFQALASASFEGSEDDAEMKDELQRLFDFTKLAENDYSMMDEDDDDDQPDTTLEDESDFDLEMDEDGFDFDEFYDMKKSSVVPVRFMHLRDAMVLYPGASIGFRHSILPIIRIRINSIDGWILGQALDASQLDGDDEPRPMVH